MTDIMPCTRLLSRTTRNLVFLVLLLTVLPYRATGQTKRAFTPEDALQVRNISIQDVTDNGRWIAATVQRRADRFNVDHQRFGDPTYISPSLREILVIDSNNGNQYRLTDQPEQVSSLTWDRAGRRLAFYMLREGSYGLYVYDTQSNNTDEIVLATSKKLASNAPLEWHPDGASVLVSLRSDEWEDEARQAFLVLTEGPVIVQDSRKDFLAWERVRNMSMRSIPALVNIETGSVDEILPETSMRNPLFATDGSFMTYEEVTPKKTGYRRNEGTEYELLRLDLDEDEPVSISEPAERRLSRYWNHDGDAFAYAEDGNVYVRDLAADSALNITEEFRTPVSEDDSTRLTFSFVRWRPDDQRLLVASQNGYHILNPGEGEMELVYTFEEDEDARPNLTVQDWTEDGRFIFIRYAARDHWERGLLRFNLSTRDLATLIKDTSLYRDWYISEDGSTFVFRMSDGDFPDDLYVADRNFEDVRKLSDLNPWLEEVAITRSELVEYRDVDGNRLYGVLYYPVGYEPGETYPLVAEIYERYFDNGFHESMNLITSKGWFGFRPSVNLEEGYPGEAWLKGVTTGINKLIDDGLVDEKRLGVHGTSYGGYAVNLLITQTDRFAAAVNISGKVNIISFLGDSPKITTRNYRAAEEGQDRIGATLWEQPQKYIAHTAIMFADRIETPLLMLSGEGDWNVPATNQREMYYALRRLGKEVVWVHYMNAGHGAGRAGTEADYFDHWQRMFDWYSEHFDKAIEETGTDGE